MLYLFMVICEKGNYHTDQNHASIDPQQIENLIWPQHEINALKLDNDRKKHMESKLYVISMTLTVI